MGLTLVGVLLAAAIAIGSVGYFGATRALGTATDEQFSKLGLLFEERGHRLVNPVESQLNVLVHDPLVQATNLPERLERLPVLAAVLRSNPTVKSVYVGYGNGEFIL
ncbi:MAG: hypothetical protein ACPGNT_11665, partial [Rhodospirillales bacterium]